MPQGRADPPDSDPELVGLDPEVEPDPDGSHHARATLPHLGLVLAGGAIGTFGRDLLLRAAPSGQLGFPWMLATLNVFGAAALGLIVARLLDPAPRAIGRRLFLATGVLGGFTTYSSLVSAAVLQGHGDRLGTAFATLLATSVVGVAAAWLGGRGRAAA